MIRLPNRVLVDPSDAEKLRQGWAEQKNHRFWHEVQELRQRKARLILENPDTWVTPLDFDELPIG